MDVWSDTFFPGNIGLWLLVTTISRKVDQLNFPLHALAAAKGIDSEIVHLKTRDGTLRLSSRGRKFGDAGFYRVQRIDGDRLLAWRVSTLHEDFRVYVDEERVLRCDHSIRLLGMPILHLHYRIERKRDG